MKMKNQKKKKNYQIKLIQKMGGKFINVLPNNNNFNNFNNFNNNFNKFGGYNNFNNNFNNNNQYHLNRKSNKLI